MSSWIFPPGLWQEHVFRLSSIERCYSGSTKFLCTLRKLNISKVKSSSLVGLHQWSVLVLLIYRWNKLRSTPSNSPLLIGKTSKISLNASTPSDPNDGNNYTDCPQTVWRHLVAARLRVSIDTAPVQFGVILLLWRRCRLWRPFVCRRMPLDWAELCNLLEEPINYPASSPTQVCHRSLINTDRPCSRLSRYTQHSSGLASCIENSTALSPVWKTALQKLLRAAIPSSSTQIMRKIDESDGSNSPLVSQISMEMNGYNTTREPEWLPSQYHLIYWQVN